MSEGIKLTEDEIHPPGRLLRVARKDSLLFLSIVRWDISLALNMTYFLSPIGGVAATSPEGGSEICLCEGA